MDPTRPQSNVFKVFCVSTSVQLPRFSFSSENWQKKICNFFFGIPTLKQRRRVHVRDTRLPVLWFELIFQAHPLPEYIVFISYLHIYFYISSSGPVQTDRTRSSLKPELFSQTILFRCSLVKKQNLPHICHTYVTRVSHERHTWLCGEFTSQPHVWCDILAFQRHRLLRR